METKIQYEGNDLAMIYVTNLLHWTTLKCDGILEKNNEFALKTQGLQGEVNDLRNENDKLKIENANKRNLA